MTTVAETWTAARSPRRTRPARRPVLLVLVAWLGAHLPPWRRVRTAVMQTGAFAAVDFGLFHAGHTLAGFIGIGVSLLVLEALGERAR